MSLTITKLQKKIADQAVLNNITFSLSLGQVVGLVGPWENDHLPNSDASISCGRGHH